MNAAGNITKELIGLSLYTINKTAKSYRDDYLLTNNKNSFKEMKRLYALKSKVLKTFNPIEKHKQVTDDYIKKLVFEYDGDFDKTKGKTTLIYNDLDQKFVKAKLTDQIEKKKLYFTYYEIGGFKFHDPISEERYRGLNLNKKRLDSDFYTTSSTETKLLHIDKAISICNTYLNSIKSIKVNGGK